MFFAVYFHINVLLSFTHCLNSPRYICGDVSLFLSPNLVFTSQLEKQSIKICWTECNQSNEVFGCSSPTCERLMLRR